MANVTDDLNAEHARALGRLVIAGAGPVLEFPG
jgi:hypothetical protein